MPDEEIVDRLERLKLAIAYDLENETREKNILKVDRGNIRDAVLQAQKGDCGKVLTTLTRIEEQSFAAHEFLSNVLRNMQMALSTVQSLEKTKKNERLITETEQRLLRALDDSATLHDPEIPANLGIKHYSQKIRKLVEEDRKAGPPRWWVGRSEREAREQALKDSIADELGQLDEQLKGLLNTISMFRKHDRMADESLRNLLAAMPRDKQKESQFLGAFADRIQRIMGEGLLNDRFNRQRSNGSIVPAVTLLGDTAFNEEMHLRRCKSGDGRCYRTGFPIQHPPPHHLQALMVISGQKQDSARQQAWNFDTHIDPRLLQQQSALTHRNDHFHNIRYLFECLKPDGCGYKEGERRLAVFDMRGYEETMRRMLQALKNTQSALREFDALNDRKRMIVVELHTLLRELEIALSTAVAPKDVSIHSLIETANTLAGTKDDGSMLDTMRIYLVGSVLVPLETRLLSMGGALDAIEYYARRGYDHYDAPIPLTVTPKEMEETDADMREAA